MYEEGPHSCHCRQFPCLLVRSLLPFVVALLTAFWLAALTATVRLCVCLNYAQEIDYAKLASLNFNSRWFFFTNVSMQP